MSATFKVPEMRTEIAGNFIKQFTSPTSTPIYLMIGRENNPKGVKADLSTFANGDGQWEIDANDGVTEIVPNPEDQWNALLASNVKAEEDLWDHAIAGQRIENRDVLFVIPSHSSSPALGEPVPRRYSEIDVTRDDHRVYEAYDFFEHSDDYNFTAHNLLINDDREVFICVKVPEAGHEHHVTPDLVPSTAIFDEAFVNDTEYFKDGLESILALPTGVGITSEMQYIWKYVGTIDIDIWENIVHENSKWIPLNFYTTVSNPSPRSQDSLNSPYGNMPYILGARHVIFRALLKTSNVPDQGMPTDLEYRQVWLIANPNGKAYNDVSFVPATFTYGYMPNSDPAMSTPLDVAYDPGQTHGVNTINTFEKYSGRVLYVENRLPISRANDQTEEVFAVFSY